MALSRPLAIVVLAISALAVPAWADWTVSRISPPSRYALDGRTWRLLTEGMEVPRAVWMTIGRRGCLLLRRSGDVIQFKPNTVAAVSSPAEYASTSMQHKSGEILFDLQPGAEPSVETSHRGAIVRGSRRRFEVGIDLEETRLNVARGVVQAVDLLRGRRLDVRAVRRIAVCGRRHGPLRVIRLGPKVPVIRVQPCEPWVSPARPASPGRSADAAPGNWHGNDDDDPVVFERTRTNVLARRAREESRTGADRGSGAKPGCNGLGGVPDGGGDVSRIVPGESEPRGEGDGSGDGGSGPVIGA